MDDKQDLPAPPPVNVAPREELGDALSTKRGDRARKRKKDEGEGARIDTEYEHRREKAIAVTRDDLRELGTLSWLQEGLGAIGQFFLSGALWVLVTLLIEHGFKQEFYPWYLVLLVITIFGVLLLGTAIFMFRAKQKRLNKYFPKEEVK